MHNTFLLVCAMIICGVTNAQQFGKAEYEQLKSLTIENLERDSYVVFDEEGFILDRYELKPAYVFTFSDQIERKVYVYLVYPLETEDTLGCVLFYQREEVTIALPVPGVTADREAWGLYIDDLKYVGEDEPGFLACVSFVISKEFSALLAGSSGSLEEEGEYEYCFPSDAMVLLASGKELPISELEPGMEIMSWDSDEERFCQTVVTGLDVHLRESIPLFEIWMTDPGVLLTQTVDEPVLKLLSLTPNHPIESTQGRMRAEEVAPGMNIFLEVNGELTAVPVMASRPSLKTETKVYSILTSDMPFFVEAVMVWPK